MYIIFSSKTDINRERENEAKNSTYYLLGCLIWLPNSYDTLIYIYLIYFYFFYFGSVF